MAITIADDTTFQNVVLEAKQPVLVDFFAEWCGPCKMLSPLIEQMATEFEGKVKFVKVNTDNSHDTASKYEVKGIPTLLIFKDGLPVDRSVGNVRESVLRNFIQTHA